jgi:hypothetical protein
MPSVFGIRENALIKQTFLIIMNCLFGILYLNIRRGRAGGGGDDDDYLIMMGRGGG